MQKAKYTALPLPRGKTGPTTIYAFQEGQLFVVRNAQGCLPLPVTSDPSVDTVQFTREYKFALKGIAGFLAKLLGIGDAKGELEVHNVKTATIQMGGLSHDTIETGALVDYLMKLPVSSCLRDLLDPDHLTIVAALKAETFTFSFKSSKGTVVKLTVKEATGLFQVDANVGVEVNEEGQITVKSPSYVGVISWNGRTMKRELDAAKKFRARLGLRAYAAPAAQDRALAPDDVHALRLKSLGLPAAGGSARSKKPPRGRG